MSSVNLGSLSEVTTAGGLYPALDTAIIQLTMPFMYARSFMVTRDISGMPGNVVTFTKQSGSRSAVFSEIAESALIPMDSTPYSYTAVQVYKVAEGFLVTRELIEDTMLPVVQDHMVRFGIRAANKIDVDCWNTIINGATTTHTATGKSLGSTGTIFSAYRSGAIGQQDVVQSISDIKQVNYFPDYLGINPIQEQDLYMLPMFTLAWHYGVSITREGTLTAMPENPVYGTQVVVSNNVPAGTAVTLASGNAPNPNNQYAPGLFFVEKRPLTTEQAMRPERDAQAVYFTARYAPYVEKPEVISLQQGLATS